VSEIFTVFEEHFLESLDHLVVAVIVHVHLKYGENQSASVDCGGNVTVVSICLIGSENGFFGVVFRDNIIT